MPQQAPSNPQSGAVLLLVVTALSLLSGIVGYEWIHQRQQQLHTHTDQQRLQRMHEAKEQVILFSESIPELYAGTSTRQSPGFLLCPDMDALNSANVGSSNGSCSWATGNAIGRLPSHKSNANGQYFYFSMIEPRGGDPWWFMIHDALRLGASGSRSFYALRKNPVYDSMDAHLTLDGIPIVAAILYGNHPLSHQTQRNPIQTTAQQWGQFLESPTVTSLGAQLTSIQDVSHNDHIVVISKTEFDTRIRQKVCTLARQHRWCETYASLSPTHWFKEYQWAYTGTSPRICALSSGTNTPIALNSTDCAL